MASGAFALSVDFSSSKEEKRLRVFMAKAASGVPNYGNS
jgi:hypothetical protein